MRGIKRSGLNGAGAATLMMAALMLPACSKSNAAEQSAQINKLTQTHNDIKSTGMPSQVWGDVAAAPINYKIETVAENIDHPWSLAFLPEGGMLVTERGGLLKFIAQDGSISVVKDFANIQDAPVHTKPRSQAGLFEVALHPEFAQNRQIFVSYAAKTSKRLNTLAIRRFTYANGQLDDGTQIFAAKPARKSSNHYGGRIAFMPDGTLLIPHGDAYGNREDAQRLDNHFGKVLRIHTDGTIPQDNPFIDAKGALPEIWSYGHRNPQGIILGADGRIYESEHGPRGGDEINLIEPGVNYGWPAATYGIDYSGAAISPFSSLEGMRQSLVHFVPSIAPGGLTQYSGTAFPELGGDLLLPALARRHVRHVELNPDGSLGAQSEMFGELGVRFRDVKIGPDGYIYLLIEEKNGPNGKIVKAIPK